MNAFTASAVALLSRYSNNLLKEQSESALSGNVQGNECDTARIVQTIISFIDSFEEREYLVKGIYRLSGSVNAQQNALQIIENAKGSPLKMYFIYELSPEDKASCIKNLLRKIPDTLYPHCQRAALVDISVKLVKNRDENEENENGFRALQILTYFIPDSHKRCLESLLGHLSTVAVHSAENKMDENNLGLIFCPYIFPVLSEYKSMEDAKEEIDRFTLLFPILLAHREELFQLSDELLQTLDASLMKQAIEHNINSGGGGTSSSRISSPFLTPIRSDSCSRDDPEVVMVQSFSARVGTPSRATTDLEMAKLAANIASMSEGPAKRKLLRKVKSDQRQKLGIRKTALLKRPFVSKN